MPERFVELLEAFPPRLVARELLTAAELWDTYVNDKEFEAGSLDQTWNTLSPEFVEYHRDALRWMSPAAFATLLPAYLASLLRGDTENELPDFVLVQLTRRAGWEEEFDTRAAHLTGQQHAVIVRVLEALESGDRFSHYRTEIRAALDSWRAVLARSMKFVTLDTNVWQYTVMRASPADQRAFVQALAKHGLRLAYTYELLREVVENREHPENIQHMAEVILKLTGGEFVESNALAEARELCEALERDHPDSVIPPDAQTIHEHESKMKETLAKMAAGEVKGREIPKDEPGLLAWDGGNHQGLRHGRFREWLGTDRKWSVETLVPEIRCALAARRDASPPPESEPRDKIETFTKLPPWQIEKMFQWDLLYQAIDAMDGPLGKTDLRHLYVDRLRCDALSFARWVVDEMQKTDLPTMRIGFAIALAQTLRRHKKSDMGDREHGSVLSSCAALFVTADDGLAAALGHRTLRNWIPQQRFAYLERADGDDALVRLVNLVSRCTATTPSG